MNRKQFDANLIVIGAGSAGLVSAYIAAAIKAKVILIEKAEMGGDCLNTGCVPSKALIHAAKQVKDLRAGAYGLEADGELDFSAVMAQVKNVIAKIAPHDSVERYEGLGVEVIKGEAEILSANEVAVNGQTLRAKSVIIASGAEPFVPPIPGLDEVDYLTSDNLWSLEKLPKKLAVLGGGPIGCELAQSFARLGSEVSIVEMLPKIMIREDDEISTLMSEKFEREGVHLLTSHKALRVEASGGDTHTLVCEYNGQEVSLEFDRILVAVGRKARVSGFGLDKVGVEISQRGTLEVDEYLQTTIDGIYACGDVAGPYQFTHTASHQAWYAAVNALVAPFKRFKVDYSVIPWATFTDPEVARVGLNEQDAKAQNIAYEVTRYELNDLDRMICEGEDEGVIKVLTQPGKDKILGAMIVGAHAGELVAEFVLAMKHGLGMNKLLGTIHIYPTRMEGNKFTAGNWKRSHAPAWALNLAETFFRFRRK